MKSLDLCAYCDAPTWCYPTPKGPICEACRVVRFFRRVLFAPMGFRLLPWQETVLRGLYGPVDADSGLRRIRRGYIEVAKKNGKSFMIGGLPVYHLAMDEPDTHPEVYGCAAAKDQAGIVYRAAARLVEKNPSLKERLKLLPSTKRIVRKDGAGFYAVLSADGDLQDGVEPSLAIIDELHRWKTAKAKTLWDVLTSGTISRPEPLTVEITTAGDVYESPICWPEHEYARQILEGSLQSDRFYAAIWAADEDRIKADPEFWKTREARVQANPSHEDDGGFLKDEALEAICQEAQDKPAEQARYMRYHLNLWHQRTERWMPMDAWRRCSSPLPPLVGRECWAGLDLSMTTDLTALVFVFPGPEDFIDLLPFFWLPRERVAAISKRVHQDLHRWIREGLIELTDAKPTAANLTAMAELGFSAEDAEKMVNSVIDYEAVRKKLHWAREAFTLREIPYDPHNSSSFVEGSNGLIADGFKCIKIQQTPAVLSQGMKFLLEHVLQGKVRHGGHEVLTWNADCVSVRQDVYGNIAPNKDRELQEGKRIDGISAVINALVRLMVARPATSYWAGEKIVI